MHLIALLLTAFGLGACVAPVEAPHTAAITLTPDANGLAVAPSGLRIDFDRAPAGVIAVLDRIHGPHKVLTLAGCPAGIRQNLAWGALTLTFTDEGFVGWRKHDQNAGQTCNG